MSKHLVRRVRSASYATAGVLLGWVAVGAAQVVTVPADDLERLQQVLKSRGWAVERSADGSTILKPAAPPAPPAGAGAGAAGVVAAPQDIESLRRLLEPRGWKVERDAAGSLILVPGAAPPTPRPVLVRRSEAGADAVNIDALRSALTAAGWGVEVAGDGSLLLYPPPQVSTKAESAGAGTAPRGVSEAAPGAGAVATVPAGDLQGLAAVLEQRGWWVQRESDGGLRVGVEPLDAGRGGTGEAPRGVVPDVVTQGRVKLPLDWHGAKLAAKSWLESTGAQGLALGRIRKINRTFVVSIVDASPPHALREQLVIRDWDGSVIPLF